MKGIRLTIALGLMTGSVVGQSLYNNSTTLFVGSSTILSVSDSIVNNGTLINNGDIEIAGIWQNNATYEPGNGQLVLTSNQPQVINHNAQSFTRLTISGGGEKIFGADIHIENELVLDDGILVSSNNSRIIVEDGATISGGSDQSFIEGPVYQIGNGTKFYPVGMGNTFLPVQLVDIQGDNPTLGVLLFSPNPNLSVSGNLNEVTGQQYWQLDVLNGTFDGAGVVLPLRDELFLESVEDAVVAQSSALDEPFTSIGSSATTGDVVTGSVTSQELATEAYLTVGSYQAETGTELNVYNAVSPNEDGINDFFKIQNITLYPNNLVTIYTRWGDKIFEMSGYDNSENIFNGYSNVGKRQKLPDGTYYYVIEKDGSSDKVTGFIVLRN